jgi:hypothetical protein
LPRCRVRDDRSVDVPRREASMEIPKEKIIELLEQRLGL